jgi:anti-sigma factor RsiW
MDGGTGAIEMTCDEAEILLHALIDGELDAGHAREVEAHIAGCVACAASFAAYRQMSQKIANADLRYTAPAALRRRIEASLPQSTPSSLSKSLPRSLPMAPAPSRRSVLRGFAMGSAVSALAATGIVAIVLRADDEQRIMSEVVSAHLRSLQAGHLTDVVSTDQHTVKPWFNGRLDVSPPVIDLTSKGFTLVGGRLDYIDARAIGAVVYRRRQHVINLFVSQTANTERRAAKIETIQGFNIRRWSDRGLNYWAISDIGADELNEFGDKFEAAVLTNTEG